MSNKIYVWPIPLDDSSTTNCRWWRLLSKEEQARARRFRQTGDRDRWVVAHGALRRILGHLAGCEPAQIAIATEKDGKPHLVKPIAAACWHFNLSHSHQMALVGVTKVGPLGVDIEHVRAIPDMGAVAARVFGEREQRDLAELDGQDRVRGFYNGWTRKESLIKATGAGMSQNLKLIDVTLMPGERALVRVHEDGDPGGWQLRSLNVDSDYAAAIAIRSDRPFDTAIRSLLEFDLQDS